MLQSQRQRSGVESEEELSRVKRSNEKLESRVASLREQLSDKEVQAVSKVVVVFQRVFTDSLLERFSIASTGNGKRRPSCCSPYKGIFADVIFFTFVSLINVRVFP